MAAARRRARVCAAREQNRERASAPGTELAEANSDEGANGRRVRWRQLPAAEEAASQEHLPLFTSQTPRPVQSSGHVRAAQLYAV